MPRKLFCLAAALAAILLTTVVAGPANAATTRRHYGSAYVGCLDGAQVVNSATWEAYTSACNSGDYQKWDETTLTGGKVMLKQVQSKKCLTAWGPYVELWTCDSSNNRQLWVKQLEATNRYSFRNAFIANCMQAPNLPGKPVTNSPCSYGSNQQWSYAA